MNTKLVKTGKIVDGQEVLAIELHNTKGTYVKIYNYGAIINKFVVTNKHGEKQDIVLGFDDFDQYLGEDYRTNYPFLGAVIGRYANRIKDGKFSLDGTDYQLVKNNGTNCLHGGKSGFDSKVWEVLSTIDPSLTMRYVSAAGEEGFPGNLVVELTFTLTDEDELILDYKATTDAATPINMTHHGYFNLNPKGGSVMGHQHRMPASHYLEQDDTHAATGKLIPVEGTIHDFLSSRAIGANWDADLGYDQSYVLDKEYGELTLASETTAPESGLNLSVYTTEPVAHFYTARYLSVANGKGGAHYKAFDGFCVETQHAPNSVNLAQLPNTILRPGEVYQQTTIYKVSHQ